MKKILSTIVLLCIISIGYCQEDEITTSTYTQPPPPVIAMGCDDVRDNVRCTSEKIYNASIKTLDAANIQKIINATDKDTLNVNTKLRFTSKRKLYLHRTSLRFTEQNFYRLNVRVDSSVKKIEFTTEPFPERHKGLKYASSYSFRLKIDRENNTLIPLYDYDSKKRMKRAPDQFIIHPNCEGLKTYQAQKKCFRNSIKELITKNFNSEIAKDVGITEVIKAYIDINFDKEGNVDKIRVSTGNTKVSEEIKHILTSIPKVKPASLQGKPKYVSSSYVIKFKLKIE